MLLVTGANGQVGKALSRVLPDAVFADSAMLDITDQAAVLRFADKHQIATIINCAAYTAVDKAEDEPQQAYKVNALALENLAATQAKIIHLSTDYVFDGQNYKPYTEGDQPNPQSVYGKSKYAGEQALLEKAETAIILRTSWVYGVDGHNFVKTMMRLSQEKEQINVVCDQIGTPTFANDLAEAIECFVSSVQVGQKGIYHYSNEGVCSWYDFAIEIMRAINARCAVMPIETHEYPTKAMRPFYSVLNKTKIKNDLGLSIPHWKESLQKCLKQF